MKTEITQARQAMLNARARMQRDLHEGEGASMTTLAYEEACDTLLFATMQQYEADPDLQQALVEATVENICEMGEGDIFAILEKQGSIDVIKSADLIEVWGTQSALDDWCETQVG